MDPHFKGSKDFYKKFQKSIKFSSKNINPDSQVILSASEFNRYIELESHQQLLDVSEKYGKDNCFCESRINCSMINLFFDYDCKDDPQTTSQCIQTLKSLKSKIFAIFPSLNIQFYVKDSEEPSGRINSMHIITHLSTPDGYSIYFDYSKGCSQVKHLVSKLNLQHPFDHKQAYSGHLLRLIYSNKFDKSGNLTNRIFDYSPLSDSGDDPLLSLSSYCTNQKYMLVDEYVNKHFILQYVKSHQYSKNYLFKDIIQRPNESHLSLTLTEQHTPVCEHKSNNAVCMFYNNSNNPNIIIKCQDEECGKFFQTFFHYDDNTHRCQIITTGNNSSDTQTSSSNNHFHDSSSASSPNSKKKQEKQVTDLERIQQFVANLSQFLPQETAYTLLKVLSIQPNSATLLGQPPQHNDTLSLILGSDNRQFQCSDNQLTYQHNGKQNVIELWSEMVQTLKNIEKKYSEKQLEKQQIVYNFGQYIENQINNNYNSSKNEKDDTVYDDDFDTIEFKSDKHKDFFINIFNNEIQFISKLYNLDHPNEFLYVYDDKDTGQVMFFDNFDEETQTETNGGFWNMQGGFQIAKQKIRDYIVDFFNQVISQIDPKDKKKKFIQFRLNNIRNDIYNNNRFDQYLMETYLNRKIKFNNHPNYLHFQNGTFDLDQNQFIKTTPKMYNTFQIDYDYDPNVKYDNIYEQLSQIMQKNEFQWLLKQFSNCLNPNKVIEQKQIVSLVGFGDNGKTILCKLMTHALGTQAYAYNGRNFMVQAQNTSSSNATPDFAKLIYKRFCYIAELDKSLAFNQQQVKILTGGEEIQARDLYKSLITFQPSAGIFISCNQIPYIDTSDGGFLNRLKIIDLKYKFVENPAHQFQKPINEQLPHFIKSVFWKQGFMNLLIHYYYKTKLQLPKSIQKSIDLRVNLQKNPVHDWAQDNIIYKVDSFLLAEDLRQKYLVDTNNNKTGKITFNKQLNDYFQQNPQSFSNVEFKRIDKKYEQGERIVGQGFLNCGFKQT